MGTLTVDNRDFGYQWASDVNFDGIRLEVLDAQGEVIFDVGVPESGPVTVNTFSRDVSADLIAVAVRVAQLRR